MEPSVTQEQQEIAQLLLSAAIPWLKTHPWAIWVCAGGLLLLATSFVAGVSSDMIDYTKLTTTRSRAAYRIARRCVIFFKGFSRDVYELCTGKSSGGAPDSEP